MSKTIISLDDPVFQKAAALAEVFQQYCKDNNLPDTLVIGNVSHNTSAVREQEYIKGKKYEQEKIASNLGLNLLTNEETP